MKMVDKDGDCVIHFHNRQCSAHLHFLFGVQWLLIQELENDLTVLRVSRVLDFPGLPCFSEKDLQQGPGACSEF